MLFSSSKATPLKEASVEFTDSQKTETWSDSDGSLLDFSEHQNIPALSSCRGGHCGACAVQLLEGEVIYEPQPTAEVGGREILLCCAKPVTAHIKLKI